MTNKEFDIQYTRKLTGWAYRQMKWLTEKEAEKANRKRNELLNSISGSVHSKYLGNKIHTGKLSPGCATCGQGTWSCLFIGSLCTANCFFCPQDRKAKKNQPPVESGLLFDKPRDYVDYLAKFRFRGVGFSGGEPLLMFGKLVSYIRKIRESLDRKIYIWVYTNGDLVDRDKLNILKESGLNEIRFNIAARNYDLGAVKLAAGIIDTVTVEIPAIPEDYETVKRCLHKMQAAGVAHLNLHQLSASPYCYQNFINRNYTFLHQPEIPVMESEITALRLTKYALQNRIGLPINFCSLIYKHRMQKKGYRERLRPFVKKDYEGTTESGFIRRLAVQDTPANIRKLVNKFQENGYRDNLWFAKKTGRKLFIHHSLLKYVDFHKHSLFVTYLAPKLTAVREGSRESSEEIALNPCRSLFAGKSPAYQTRIRNFVPVRSYQELFIKKMDSSTVFRKFYRDYDLKTKAGIDEMRDDKDQLEYLKTWECIGSGPHEIY